jgi:hypothetical protein
MRDEFAPRVRRRTPTWPSRMATYFDCTAFGSGFFRCQGGPGAVVLNRSGQMLDIVNGRVYFDARFKSDAEVEKNLQTTAVLG